MDVDTSEPAAAAAPSRRARAAAAGPRHGLAVALRLIHLGPLLVLAALWLVLALASPYFLTTLNLTNLLQASSVVAVLAVGQLLIILTGGLDLSAGAVLALTTVVGARIAQDVTASGVLVIVAMLGTGAAVGLVNGLLVERLRLGSPFVVTLGMLSIATGLAYVLSDGATVTGLPPLLGDLGAGELAGLPAPALVAGGFALVAAVLTTCLRMGRWIYAVGGNRAAAERVGIPVVRVSVAVFCIGGAAAGLGGVLQAGLTDSGAPSSGFNVLLDAVSAVVIGGAALVGGRGTVGGTLVGALILGTIHNGLNLLGVNTNWEPVVLGSVLIVAVGLDRARDGLETRLRLAGNRRHGDLDPAGATA